MGNSILIIPRQKLFATAARFAMGSFQCKMGNNLTITMQKLLATAARFAMGPLKANGKTNPAYSNCLLRLLDLLWDHSNKMGNNLAIKMQKLLATAARFAMGPLNANGKTNPDYSKAEIVCYGC